MRKHILPRVVFLAACSLLACFAITRAGADSSTPWIANDLNFQKQAESKSTPTSLNGNIDCALEDDSNCAISTLYGAGTQNSTVRFNGTSDFNLVYSYIENRPRFIPIPNSSTAITYSAEPVYGFYLYFNYNLTASVTKIDGAAGLSPTTYHIKRPPDGMLADKSKNRLAADYGSMSFSQNGQWLVVSDPNVAMLRINLQTFEVLPFAPGFDYSIGLDPNIKTAISNDGRYAVVGSKEFNRLIIYDLSTCSDAPETITGPVVCQSRDLNALMKQQFPGYLFTSYIRFLEDNTLSIYSTSSNSSDSQTSRYIISPDTITSQLEYLALGDSYIAGEGAFNYIGGTDQVDNKCHLSSLSYPFLLSLDLNFNSYHSVACSGAITDDITNTSDSYKGQADQKQIARQSRSPEFISSVFSSFKPGYIGQVDFVSRYQPKAITLSISGNDVGMISKLKGCIEPGTCFPTYEDRLEVVQDINRIFPRLVDTYIAIKNTGPPGMRIYVIAYPQIAKPGGDCAFNVHLDSDEVTFTSEAIDYLDGVIKAAARRAGVFYTDTETALFGHRFCEAGPGSIAMNGITTGNDIPRRLNGPIGSETFHPNIFGYQLMENKILKVTNNLTLPMPNPNASTDLPSPDSSGILNAPKSGRTINTAEYDPDVSADLAYQGVPIDVSINGAKHSVAPNTVLRAELHSALISLGDFKSDSNGNLSTQITIPGSALAGYHTLHFYANDITGQSVDIYKDIYVAAAADDLDGDGAPDSTQMCVGVPPAGQDFDQDGLDDSCDGNISLPSPSTTQSGVVAVSLTSQSPNLTASSRSPQQSNSITKVAYTARTQAGSPQVLGASITKPTNPAGPDRNSLRLPPNYFVFGLGLILLSSFMLCLI